jgi:hypothetical protein
VFLCLLAASLARAEPFYMRYDATETFPEQDGWTRYRQDPEGLEKRSVEGGWLTLDTRDSYSIFDLYYTRSSAFDLQPGEQLRIAWCMQALETDVCDYMADPSVCITNAASQYVDLYMARDFVAHGGRGLEHKPDEELSIESGAPHSYLLTSDDMHTFRLDVDGEFAFAGEFLSDAAIGPNCVCFGDTFVGLRSLSTWDYFEASVVPEPSVAALVTAAGASAFLAARRTR